MAQESEYRSVIRTRFARRRLLQGAAGTSVAIVLGGCGSRQVATGGKTAGSSGNAVQPKKGGVLIHAGGSTVGSYDTSGTQVDPHINTPPAARGFRLVYQGLLGYDLKTYAVQPELAQKWEQISASELVFHLQPGVKWHDKPPVNGRELTADDVVFGLNRLRTNDPRFANRSLFDNVDKIQVVDKTTVRVTTKGPDATTLSSMSGDPALVMAPEAVEKYGKFATAESVIGTGPFVLKSLEEGVAGDYARNPAYWKQGRPYLDGVRTQHFAGQAEAYAAFQAGRIDFLLLPGQETAAYIAKQGRGVTPAWASDEGGYPTLQPNTKLRPMNDPRVTRALRLLVDHDEFITGWSDIWFGKGRHGSFLCSALDQWDFSHDEYAKMLEWRKPKDDAVKEALSLLGGAGYTKDNPLSFELAGGDVNFQSAAAQLLQAQWARLSQGAVKTSIRQYSQAEQNTIRANRSFTYFVGGNSGAFNEPDAWFNGLYITGGSRNYSGWSDPKFDEMVQKQRTILDMSQRKAYVRDMIKFLIDNAPSVIAVGRLYLNGVQPKVRDWSPEYYMVGRQYEWIWMD